MKTLSEIKALQYLQKLKGDYQNFIRENYEHKAQNCTTCPTKGACCLDAHFVNVHVSRLEAVAIKKTLSELGAEKQREVYRKIGATVEEYDLKSSGDSFAKTFACPLFEKSVGCLIHENGKPAPCISHACYEREEDLPPDDLQSALEEKIAQLNRRTYGENWNYLPLPVWLNKLDPFQAKED